MTDGAAALRAVGGPGRPAVRGQDRAGRAGKVRADVPGRPTVRCARSAVRDVPPYGAGPRRLGRESTGGRLGRPTVAVRAVGGPGRPAVPGQDRAGRAGKVRADVPGRPTGAVRAIGGPGRPAVRGQDRAGRAGKVRADVPGRPTGRCARSAVRDVPPYRGRTAPVPADCVPKHLAGDQALCFNRLLFLRRIK